MIGTTLLALVASAVSAAAAPSLSLSVTGADAVESVRDLSLSTTLTNTGDETLKLLNDPRTILRTTPTHTFRITHSDSGEAPAFNGVRVKYTFEQAATSGDEKAITVLAPGQSVTLTHDLSSAYNFTRSGEGRYNFETGNLFHYVDAAGSIQPIRAASADASHSSRLRGTLSVARTARPITKRDGCDADQSAQLSEAAGAGNAYAAGARDYLAGISSGTDRFQTWFGAYDQGRHDTVADHYARIASHDMNTYSFDCSCTDAGTYAYVYPDTFGTVYLCGAFWAAGVTGTDSRGGTLVHESSHFTDNGGTADNVYGQDGARQLAIDDPTQAINNADSHEYFAENNPEQA